MGQQQNEVPAAAAQVATDSATDAAVKSAATSRAMDEVNQVRSANSKSEGTLTKGHAASDGPTKEPLAEGGAKAGTAGNAKGPIGMGIKGEASDYGKGGVGYPSEAEGSAHSVLHKGINSVDKTGSGMGILKELSPAGQACTQVIIITPLKY